MTKIKHGFLINILLLCTALFLITSFVVGYNSSPANPGVMGHTANEINITINAKQYNLESIVNNLNHTNGRVVGGGNDQGINIVCNAWGQASCSGTSPNKVLSCQSSTKIVTFTSFYDYNSGISIPANYICITN
ncbi:MAG: hypothetical protein KJ623_02050 [Nanoarchaeota archaeon]|nr:hypothetical protein [Nanoarchaeota archaeon]